MRREAMNISALRPEDKILIIAAAIVAHPCNE